CESQRRASAKGALRAILGPQHVEFLSVPIPDSLCFHRVAPRSYRLTLPPAAPQLGIDEARLLRWLWCGVRGDGRVYRSRIKLLQEALEPLCVSRQGEAITVYRVAHEAHDFGVFFGG